jgi:hypothetical protein
MTYTHAELKEDRGRTARIAGIEHGRQGPLADERSTSWSPVPGPEHRYSTPPGWGLNKAQVKANIRRMKESSRRRCAKDKSRSATATIDPQAEAGS